MCSDDFYLLWFRLDFKVQSCLVTLTSLSKTISFAYGRFILTFVSCLIAVFRLVDRHNNFYFHLFLAVWNQFITLIIMNFNIYNNKIIFNICLAKLEIMKNAMHMACRAQFNVQRRSWSISSLVLSLLCGILIIISSIGKNIR